MKANNGMPEWLVSHCNPSTWVAIAVGVTGAVVSAGGAAYSANQQKKAAAKQSSALQSGIQTYDPVLLGDPKQVDTRKVNLDTIDQVFDQLPYATRLTDTLNAYNYKTALHYYNKIQPYFKQLQSTVGQNALSYARGEIPADVSANITRAAAQKGIQGGYGFGSQGGQSGALANLNLRNLGLTSLDLSRYGNTLGMQVNQAAKSLLPEMVNPLSLFLTPQQQLAAAEQNVGFQNQFALQNNLAQNRALSENTSLGNSLAQSLAQLNYNSQVQQGQAIGGAAQSIGGAISGLGTSGALGSGGGNAWQFNQVGDRYYQSRPGSNSMQPIPKATLA